jgi:prophage regulatory protein
LNSVLIARLPRVIAHYSKSRSAIYADVKSRLLTRPVRLGERSVGWPLHEIDAIISARIAGKSASEIRKLVAELEAARVA